MLKRHASRDITAEKEMGLRGGERGGGGKKKKS